MTADPMGGEERVAIPAMFLEAVHCDWAVLPDRRGKPLISLCKWCGIRAREPKPCPVLALRPAVIPQRDGREVGDGE